MKNLIEACEKYYFDLNYNCSESLIRGCNEYFHLDLHHEDLICFAGYGKGIMSFDMCGAFIAGVAVLSKIYVKTKAHDSEDIEAIICNYKQLVIDKLQTTNCQKIREYNFNEERRCFKTVQAICGALYEIVNQ